MKTFYLIPLVLLCIFCGAKKQTNIKNQIPNPEEIISLNESKHNIYAWKTDYKVKEKLQNRIPTPNGFERIAVDENTFADWLQNIPLKEGQPKVKLYDGSLKGNQNAQFAVVDIDVGTRDLQQCADAVMRLRAEYLFANKNLTTLLSILLVEINALSKIGQKVKDRV